MRRFNGVATKYMESYLGWHRGLDEFNGNITPATLLLRGKVVTPYKIHP